MRESAAREAVGARFDRATVDRLQEIRAGLLPEQCEKAVASISDALRFVVAAGLVTIPAGAARVKRAKALGKGGAVAAGYDKTAAAVPAERVGGAAALRRSRR